MNAAVFDGRPVLSKAKDEQPHVVLLPAAQAESEAPGPSLQLHRVTAKALQTHGEEQSSRADTCRTARKVSFRGKPIYFS